ncbi:hypothetical protein F4820DRAFT_444636 [Hypoxylon rubiginosum]|uniref:Uncharacterized protein n=1 Tax=Hypoxylon rubiginosum TaxID=110542 RepID=A0ACB9ZC26_9PEZI|nr:hypothetical protein F4820DRAFT_444636 [Hypoxylon rubiginosum]
MVTVKVQPPAQAQAGAVLYPPLVISSDSGDAYDFVQVALVDSYDRILEDQLYGTLSTSGKTLSDRSSSRSGGSTVYSVFPDLVVSYAGTYTIRVNALRMDYNSIDGAGVILTASTSTAQFTVYDQSVATEVPSPDEQTLLRRLRRNGGFNVPRSPQ